MSSVSMHAESKICVRIEALRKNSSSNGNRDVAVLQNDASYTVSTKNVPSHMAPNPPVSTITRNGTERNARFR